LLLPTVWQDGHINADVWVVIGYIHNEENKIKVAVSYKWQLQHLQEAGHTACFNSNFILSSKKYDFIAT